MHIGKFYGLGVGPGDPELISIKTVRILQQVAVISYPCSRSERDSLALSVVQPWLTGEQQLLPLVFPMTRRSEELQRSWEEAAGLVTASLRQGKDVAFITLGDSGMYSTCTYLLQAVQHQVPGVEWELVPGITSFSAAAAWLGQELAIGEAPLNIVPVDKSGDWERHLNQGGSFVLLKVAADFERVREGLRRRGLLQQAVLVSRCGLEGAALERDLALVEPGEVDYLSLVLVRGGGVR